MCDQRRQGGLRKTSVNWLKCLHSSFFPLHRALELLLKSGFGECLRPQFRAGDGRTVLVRLLVTDGGWNSRGAALGCGSCSQLNFGWSPLLLGHRCA